MTIALHHCSFIFNHYKSVLRCCHVAVFTSPHGPPIPSYCHQLINASFFLIILSPVITFPLPLQWCNRQAWRYLTIFPSRSPR